MRALRLALAFVWIHTAVTCLFVAPLEETTALAARVGLTGAAGRWTVWLTSVAEIVLGVVLAAGLWPRFLAWVQLILIAGFTGLITLCLPEYWWHPFGPVSKNVVLLASVWLVGFEREVRPPRL